jgi:acyl dehydratase
VTAPPARSAEIGSPLPAHRFAVRREDLARYAAASGDTNPIHLDDAVARSVGLPGVVAHGMLTMALAGRALTSWAGGAGTVEEYAVRFTRPVPVPPGDDGAVIEVGGTVTERPDDSTAWIDLSVSCAGQRVLGKARARVRLAAETPSPPRAAA